ncbi:eIF-2-alpha kinase activator GCN1 [Tyrophagus putrescentiae]|nr:eIF-2-alpha kinase activator GCN1 [Tyrophagus putrescentiae]
MIPEENGENGEFVLSDILQQAYLSSSAGDKSWVTLKFHFSSQTLSDEDLFGVVDFTLYQLKCRTNLKFRAELLKLLKSIVRENKQAKDYVFDQLIRKINALPSICSSAIASHLLFLPRICTLFSWNNLDHQSRKQLVEAQVSLCLFFAKSKNKFLYDINYKCLKKTLLSLDETTLNEYLVTIKGLNSSIGTSILWDNVVRFFKENDHLEHFSAHKDYILDCFNKNIVMSKTKIPDCFGSFAFANVLRQIDENDFKSILFPALQKAILRSAETSLVLISFLFEFLNFNLSNFSQEIGKLLGSHSAQKTTLCKRNQSRQSKYFLSREDDIFNALLNSSRNLTTSIAKINLLVESLYSSVILLNLYKRDHSLESKLGPFLQNLHQLDKVTFLTDKYLNEAPVESAIYLGDFISLSFQLNIAGDKRILYKMLISLICFSKSKECRDKAISLLNELAKSNSSLISEMVQTFFDLYGTEAETTAVEDSSKSDAQFLAKCVQVLINSEQIAEKSEFEVHKFALECVKICHIPRVYHYQPNLFQTFLCKRFDKGEIATFVEKNTSALVNIVFSSSLSDQIKLNTVKTLSKLNANKFISCFVREVNANLDQLLIPLKSVTSTEVEIFKTPQGTLYDKAVVKAAGDTSADKNVRRENKLYSFKDQLAEMELRKDLEAKSKHTDLDLSKLTKKQEEVYKAQLAKEEDVRNRLKLLDGKLSFNLDVLLAMIRSNPLVASIHFKEIPSTLVNLFTSELCYERSKAFTLAVSRPMMVSPATCNDLEYNKFVDTAAFTLVRLYRNPADPDNELLQLIARLVEYLYKRTCPNSGSGYDETLNRLAAQNRLSTPAFAFVFPLLRFVLLQLKASAENYDQMVDRCLQVITQHSLHRNDSAEKKGDSGLKDPQNMPNKLVLETLVKFMEKNLPDHEKTAASAVISTVGCINGSAGCGMASPGDIFVLLNSLTHLNDLIRQTCFQALDDLSTAVLPLLKEEDHCKEKLRHRVFIGRFDTLPECQAFANQIFERCAFETSGKMLETILEDDIENANAVLVVPVSEAYRFLLKQYPERLGEFYEKLTKFYSEKAKASVPSTDAFGRPLAKDHVDHYEQRLAVACIFKNIAEYFSEDQVKSFIKFLIPSALSDNNESVRNVMLEAGCQLIDFHGKNNVNYLLDVFEVFLDSAPDDHRNDLVRKSVIIFMGTLAKHIDGSNPKLKPILSKLVETLSTPSQIVQEAVANCLQYLIPKFIDDAPALLQKLLQFLFESEIYGERKGAAYGIAGIVKGLGILSLNKLGIMDALTQAIQAKDKPNNREGALFAFEMLSSMLGRLFEPYIVHILPHLLDCFGDSSVRVRQAADDSAKVIMSKLSAPGVTLIYPAILTALEDDSWRKKTSSIELLGSMAYCAPKQLSQCLPKIVPKLMDVITDSHPKVQRSAAQALKQIGSVIKNPEIQAIVPTLLEALQDPANKTNTSLNTMLTMKFVHVIDPPSLALIMPVIERAFSQSLH